MKAYGYKKNSEEFVELQEVTLECTIDELNKMVVFLQNVREEHASVRGSTDICHSHYRDWNKDWNENDSDVIIITRFESASK